MTSVKSQKMLGKIDIIILGNMKDKLGNAEEVKVLCKGPSCAEIKGALLSHPVSILESLSQAIRFCSHLSPSLDKQAAILFPLE